jgi:hypothetical protein
VRRANAGRKLLSRGVREELEVERSPLRVSDHRLERVPGGELGLLGRAFDVISAGREHLADVASAFGAAAVQELQEQLLHWAVPLGDAIARANGYRIGDVFISPLGRPNPEM